MGFKRKMGRAAPVLALLSSAAGATPREPLTITTLQDGEAALQPASIREDVPREAAIDTEAFSRAVSETVRLQQQSIQSRCSSANRASGTIAIRWAWEASCRYRRY